MTPVLRWRKNLQQKVLSTLTGSNSLNAPDNSTPITAAVHTDAALSITWQLTRHAISAAHSILTQIHKTLQDAASTDTPYNRL